MIRAKRKRFFDVRLGQLHARILANSYGHAALLAFRRWIRDGHIKNQPQSNSDGGWEGVSVST